MQNRPRSGQQLIAKDFYTYSVLFPSLAAAANDQDQINIQADSDFLWQYGTFTVDLAGAAQLDGTRVLPLVTVLLTDTASGQQLMNIPVSIQAIFGTGQLPFILPQERILRANSNLLVQVANTSAATEYADLQLNFHGRKLYYS